MNRYFASKCSRILPRGVAIQARSASHDQGGIDIHQGVGDRSKILFRAQVTEYGGRNYVHLRYFQLMDDGNCIPTKKGVSLSEEQFRELVKKIPEIEKALSGNSGFM